MSAPVKLLPSLATYVALFGILTSPWIAVATHAVPTSLFAPGDDALVAWILGWVSHALVTDPRHLMDANVSYPAPGQLTGIEHFLSWQVLFAPVFLLTGNALLAAAIVVLTSYPLAALAMQRLLLASGCGAAVAWVGGFIFALGPVRVPASLMLVKLPNLYLPLVAVSITRLREQPTARTALCLGLSFVAGLLSSYYAAVMLAVTSAIWVACEFLRPNAGRRRFAVLATTAIAVALIVLVGVSLPYFRRLEAPAPESFSAASALFDRVMGTMYVRSSGAILLVLAASGTLAVFARTSVARRLAVRGLVLAGVALVLMLGPEVSVGGWTIPMPFAVILASPARFFRMPSRFVVVFGFGAVLLAAAALEAVRRRLRPAAHGLVVMTVAVAVLLTRGVPLTGTEFREFRGQSAPIYGLIADATRDDPGPLLELPWVAFGVPGNPNPEFQAMLGSTRHWLPLVTGFVSYLPPHRPMVNRAIAALPDREALDDLVSMTHVRWLLLRPEDELPARARLDRKRLLNEMPLTPVLERDGWVLSRIEVSPRHPEWFAAIASGYQPGRSVLGTPLSPLDNDAEASRVSAENIPASISTGIPLFVRLRILNEGESTWPVTVPPSIAPTHTVRVFARWWRSDGAHPRSAVVSEQEFQLARDVPPHEGLTQDVSVDAPAAPGAYGLEMGLRQSGGADFEGARHLRLRAAIEVIARR